MHSLVYIPVTERGREQVPRAKAPGRDAHKLCLGRQTSKNLSTARRSDMAILDITGTAMASPARFFKLESQTGACSREHRGKEKPMSCKCSRPQSILCSLYRKREADVVSVGAPSVHLHLLTVCDTSTTKLLAGSNARGLRAAQISMQSRAR